VSDLAELMYFY